MIRSFVCFLYIVCMIVHVVWAPNTYLWFGFNIISMVLFGGMCCAFLGAKKRPTENERLLFWYMFGVSVVRGIYTAFCTHAYMINRKDWVPYASTIFITLVIITFVSFVIYLAKQSE